MPILRSQIIASTSVDRRGDRIPKDRLRELFDRLPDPWLLNREHDESQPPAAWAFDKEFVQLDDGEWAIRFDVEVFDETDLDRYSGFSITFSEGFRTINPGRPSEISVQFNASVFPVADLNSLVGLSTSDCSVEVSEVKQKGIDEPLILVVVFLTGQIFNGFLGGIGGDVYAKVRDQIRRVIRDRSAREPRPALVHLKFPAIINEAVTEITVVASADDIDFLETLDELDESLVRSVNAFANGRALKRIALRVEHRRPPWQLIHLVDRQGGIEAPKSETSNHTAAQQDDEDRRGIAS